MADLLDNQHNVTATGHSRFKLESRHFGAAWDLEKRAEVRMIDPAKPVRGGDYVWLDEWIPAPDPTHLTQYAAHYTGRALLVLVTHVVTSADVPELLTDDVHVWSFQIVQRHDTADQETTR